MAVVGRSLLLFSVALSAARAHAAPWLDLAENVAAAERVGNPKEILLADPASERLLRQGWATAEKWPDESKGGVWADAPVSVLEVPRARPSRTRISIRAQPHGCPGCPDQWADVDVNGHAVGRVTFPQSGFRDRSFDVPEGFFRYRDNLLRFRWGWLKSPKDYDPSSKDKRRLAAGVVSLRFEEIGRSVPHADSGLHAHASSGSLVVPSGEAFAYYLRVPARAVLAGSIARDGRSLVGSSGAARISVRADGSDADRDLTVHALSAFSGKPQPFSFDLSAFADQVVRLSLRAEDGGRGGLVVRFEGARVEAPFETADGAGALGLYRARPLEPAPRGEGERLNVILYLMDALRASDLGSYGCPEITSPFLDRLSRRGMVLADNTSQAPNTPPSVKALLTGRYLPFTGNTALDGKAETIAEGFAAGGFRTAAFSNSPWPAAVGALRGFQGVADDLWYKEGPVKDFAGRITERLAGWVALEPGRPFFAYAHSIHPHNPYAPPQPWDRAMPGPIASIAGDTRTLLEIQHGARSPASPSEQLELHRLYREDVLYNDHELATLQARLSALHIWDHTALCLLADHGDEFGEHGGILHGWTSYDEMVHVPAILYAPGRVPAGALVSDRTETIDIAPTLLSIAKLPPLPSADGRSCLPLRATVHRVYSSASSVPGIYTVVDRHHKYAFAPRNGEEVGIGEGTSRVRERFFLFDLDADPLERHNVAAAHPVLCEYLHRCLASWLSAVGGGASAAAGPELDPEQRKILKQLGYLEGD